MRLSPSTVGVYLCRASVKGFKEVSASASVLMRGPPRILRRHPVQFGTEGDTIRLTCDAFAIPPPETLLWSAHGYPVTPSTAGGHYGIEEASRNDGMRSTLIIRDSIRSDFGEYNCTVRNSHGEDTFLIKLEKKGTYIADISIYAAACKISAQFFGLRLRIDISNAIYDMLGDHLSPGALIDNIFRPQLSHIYFMRSQFSEHLSLVIIIPAIVGGVILTMFAIVVMLMCRRSKALATSVSEKTYSTTTTAATSSSSKHLRVPPATTTEQSSTSGASTAGLGGGGGGEHQRLPGVKSSLLTPASASEDWEEDSLDGQFGRSSGGHRPRIVAGFSDYTVSIKKTFGLT